MSGANPSIDLRRCGASELLSSLSNESVDGVVADPPWSYARASNNGGVAAEYGTAGDSWIAELLSDCYRVAREDSYLAVWCTWPKLFEWADASKSMPWRYLTGGAWTKSNGFGVGYHAAGDSEFWLLYGKGSPRPADGRQSNAVHAPRVGHSEKPQAALDALVRTVAGRGGLVLDPFAGESASLARCCARLGRRYVGAEIDPERHAAALRRLAGESRGQAAMAHQASLPLRGARP